MLNRGFFFLLIIFVSCSQPKPRKPVSHTSSNDLSSSILFNKKMYENESKMIENYMKKDSIHQYINSQYGFWYAYIDNIENDNIVPVKGNIVSLEYGIKDFNGNEIYNEDEIGSVKYRVDQEEMIKGIQEGVKWMNEGEKIIFLFPSHKAYAYHGDESKIGPNTPIIVTLKLVDIQKN